MKKIAKLVTITLTTRVVVKANATEEEIARASKENFLSKISNNEIQENIDVIMDDEECPYDAKTDETGSVLLPVYYQPDFSDPDVNAQLSSFMVFADKEIAQKAFPNAKINEYSGNDIEEPTFMDDVYSEYNKGK